MYLVSIYFCPTTISAFYSSDWFFEMYHVSLPNPVEDVKTDLENWNTVLHNAQKIPPLI